jgi:hypothetical protein
MRIAGILLIFLLSMLSSCAQNSKGSPGADSEISVEKQHCTSEKYSGEKIVIRVIQGKEELLSNRKNYNLHQFQQLDLSIKLKIVDALLSYKSDTSTACLPVSSYGYNGIENTCRGNPQSKRLSIQVEALYLINQLFYQHASSFYFCYPVIVENETGKEVNDDAAIIELFYQNYEKWYAEVKRTGKINKDFPFNTGAYSWYGGRKSEGEVYD